MHTKVVLCVHELHKLFHHSHLSDIAFCMVTYVLVILTGAIVFSLVWHRHRGKCLGPNSTFFKNLRRHWWTGDRFWIRTHITMCFSKRMSPKQLSLFPRVSLKQVINAVTDGSELLWKQKNEMIMAGPSKIKKQSSYSESPYWKEKRARRRKNTFLFVFKSSLFILWQKVWHISEGIYKDFMIKL